MAHQHNIGHHRMYCIYRWCSINHRGVDPYGTGGTRPHSIWTGGHYHEHPPQYF